MTEVMSQTEDSHPSASVEDQELSQPQENKNPSSETELPVSQATSTTSSNLEPEEKSQSPLASYQQTVYVKKEDVTSVQVVPESCDDPSDTDYTPSKSVDASVSVLNVQVMSNCFQSKLNKRFSICL